MPDRELRVADFIRLFQAHGCEARINSNQFVLVSRNAGGEHRTFSQHAHKGMRDRFHRNVVRRCRKRLGFAKMSDDQFYKPLD